MTHAFHTRRSSDLERGTGTSVEAVVGVALVDLAGEVPAAATAHEPTTVPVWRPAPAAPVPAVPLLLDHLHRVEPLPGHERLVDAGILLLLSLCPNDAGVEGVLEDGGDPVERHRPSEPVPEAKLVEPVGEGLERVPA